MSLFFTVVNVQHNHHSKSLMGEHEHGISRAGDRFNLSHVPQVGGEVFTVA